MPLTMRRTVIAGRYLDDDFCAFDDRLRVGRILLHPQTPQGPQWAWHINIDAPIPGWCNGHCLTLEEAKAEFRAAWDNFKPTLGEAKLAALKDWQDTESDRHDRRKG